MQQLAEQVVVAVPLAATVQRNHEQVASFELLEHPDRPFAAGHGVAERSAHPVEDRRAHEEADLRAREAAQQLGVEVFIDEAVVAAEAESRGWGTGLDRERGQVEAGRPSLRTLHERVGFGRGHIGTGLSKESGSLLFGHGEVVDADLHHSAVHPEPGQGNRQSVS